jgi:hypothetical protein
MQNGFVESLNGRLRDEYLNKHVFRSLLADGTSSKTGRSTTTTTGRIPASPGGLTERVRNPVPGTTTRTESGYKRGQRRRTVTRHQRLPRRCIGPVKACVTTEIGVAASCETNMPRRRHRRVTRQVRTALVRTGDIIPIFTMCQIGIVSIIFSR